MPVGGLDIFADHWFQNGGYVDDAYHLRGGNIFNGPIRAGVQIFNITGIENNASTPEATAVSVSGEAYLLGPFTVGGSFGKAESDSLKWSHLQLHGRYLLAPFLAVHVGVIDETYEYSDNRTTAANFFQNEVNGITAGVSLFGSPTPGFFFQLGASALPIKAIRSDGIAADDGNFRFRLDGQFGLTVFGPFDLSIMASATSGLGDLESTSLMAGLGASLTF